MKVRHLIFTALLSLGLTAAYAEEVGQGPGMHKGEMREEMKKRCEANPEKCAEMKERVARQREEIHAACEKEPGRCKEIRHEHREQMREKMCAEHPQKCEEMKARHAEMKNKCEADPKACEERKAEMREKMKERREQRRGDSSAEVKPAVN